jgi:hypothetical protein
MNVHWQISKAVAGSNIQKRDGHTDVLWQVGLLLEAMFKGGKGI